VTDASSAGDGISGGLTSASGPVPGADGGSPRGVFIVFEGVEGSGKSTQITRLERWLRDALALSVTSAREPGGTAAGEAIRGVLLDRAELRIAPESELLLMLAARAAFVRELVRPVLRDGGVMLADRFELSTFAYQGFGRGLPLDRVREMNAFATGGVRPDLVLLLDLPAEAGRARQRREGKAQDRIEAASEAFHEAVAAGYRSLGASEPGTVVIAADGPPDVVEREIRAAVLPLLLERFPELGARIRGSTT
jgi:dTMP kinase